MSWYDRHRGARTIIVAWLVTRTLSLLLFATKAERFMVGDVYYYWRKLNALGEVGLAGTLNEYPTPVVWILWPPFGAVGGSRVGYLVAFMVLMLLIDAAFITRSTGPPAGSITSASTSGCSSSSWSDR